MGLTSSGPDSTTGDSPSLARVAVCPGISALGSGSFNPGLKPLRKSKTQARLLSTQKIYMEAAATRDALTHGRRSPPRSETRMPPPAATRRPRGDVTTRENLARWAMRYVDEPP